MIWKNILQTKEGVLVSSSPLPKQRKKKKPIPEPTKKDCRKYIMLMDKLTKALVVSVNRLVDEYEEVSLTWPDTISYNFTPNDNMHRMADIDIYEKIDGKEMSIGIIDCIWVSGDNISEENACILLRQMGNIEWVDKQYDDIPTKEYSTTRDWGMKVNDLSGVSNFQLGMGTIKKIRPTPFIKGLNQMIESFITEFEIYRKRGYEEAMKK